MNEECENRMLKETIEEGCGPRGSQLVKQLLAFLLVYTGKAGIRTALAK